MTLLTRRPLPSDRRDLPPMVCRSLVLPTRLVRVGIHAFHGHRHLYAQACYQGLTGWQCPARGGPTAKQKETDREAREAISHEMGHGREQITAVYLGQLGLIATRANGIGGWRSSVMVERYAHLAPDHLAKAANRLDSLFGGYDLATPEARKGSAESANPL